MCYDYENYARYVSASSNVFTVEPMGKITFIHHSMQIEYIFNFLGDGVVD